MTWKEIEILDRDNTFIIFPTGAIEQHGPQLPIDTDIYNSTTISEEVARKFVGGNQRVLVAPPIPWGTSPHHLGFPGTLSLRPETFSSIIFDVISSLLPHGFYRFLLMNGHGGNAGILTATVSQLSDDLGISVPTLSYWTMIKETLIAVGESPIGGMGHACEMETSLALHMRADLVDMSLAVREMPRELTSRSSIDFRAGGPVGIPLDFLRDSKHGVMGDPTLATAQKGERIFTDACENISALISELFLLEKSQLRKN
ncbi:MAG: creatininase family protein [Actinobacteria bacterium]|nr:creatininase family protein [Actinomycetota bacterium]